MLKDVKRADALAGARGNSFMQQSVARGLQAAGENGGGSGMAFMGMGVGAAGNVMNGVQQPNNPSSYQQTLDSSHSSSISRLLSRDMTSKHSTSSSHSKLSQNRFSRLSQSSLRYRTQLQS